MTFPPARGGCPPGPPTHREEPSGCPLPGVPPSITSAPARENVRHVKGSHIVVPRIHPEDHAYILQNADKRIVFVIPYAGNYSLIGTTDVEHHGAIGDAHIDPSETAYLCEQASRYFERPVTPGDVVWTYSGVRPLMEDAHASAQAASRDFRLAHDTGGAPMLTVFGGKITTFRKLAEEAVDWIPLFGIQYKVGADGLSVALVVLTTTLSWISILASFSPIRDRVKEYMISFLILEVGMIGTFCARASCVAVDTSVSADCSPEERSTSRTACWRGPGAGPCAPPARRAPTPCTSTPRRPDSTPTSTRSAATGPPRTWG